MNTLCLLLAVIRIFQMLYISNEFVENTSIYINLILTCIDYLYFCSMFFNTGDRLMGNLLNLRYKIFWSVRKTKVMLVCMWCFFLLITRLVLTPIYLTQPRDAWKDFIKIQVVYIQMVLCALFPFFAVVSYFVIFTKYTRSRRRSTSTYHSSFILFRTSKF